MGRRNRRRLGVAIFLASGHLEARYFIGIAQRVLDVERNAGAIRRGTRESTEVDFVGAERRTDLPDRRKIERRRGIF